MTRLLTCGYETADVAESGATTLAANATAAAVSSTPTPRSPSAYCLKFAGTGVGTGAGKKTFTLPVSKTDVWTRFALYIHLPVSSFAIYQALDSAASLHGSVTFDPADGFLRATRPAVLLAQSTLILSQDQWHTIDVRWQVTSTTVGTVEVWVDEARWINFSGDNTSTTNVNVQGIVVGDNAVNNFTAGTGYVAYDDVAINDTAGSVNNGRIGQGSVVLLKPNGAGTNTAQTRGGTDSGANWDQVNEVPPSMSDYVYHATAGTRDTYTLEDVPSGSWTVNCVEVLAYGMNSDASAGSLGLTVKSGATTNEGTAQVLATTAQYVRQLHELDPNGSVAWTTTAVNALEAGTTVR